MSGRAPIIARGLAVLSAVCLVGAFALAIAFPPSLSLQRLIARFAPTLVPQLGDWVRDHLGDWAWTALALPLLGRPSWLAVLGLGLVLLGLAFTVRGNRGLADSARGRN